VREDTGDAGLRFAFLNRMRVGINVAVLSGRLTGVGCYVLCLVQALARVAKDIEWVLLGADPAVDSIPQAENIQILRARGLAGARGVAWQQWVLPRWALRAGVQILHCPDYHRPVFSPVPVVNTIHDLSFYPPPPFLPLFKRTVKGMLARVAIERSVALVADSHFTRQEILKRFHIDPRRITVIHLAATEVSDQPREKAGRPFILFVGTLESRKNVTSLIKAFTSLRARGRIAHRLVLVGQRGWGWPKIRASIESSPFRDEIELVGYASRDEVVRFYRSADLFVFPSLYEGFGIPVLEAMACGTPVVCSRAASLPEVAGDAAEFFDPYNVEDLAAAIERVLECREYQATLRRKGKERAKRFSWDECARRHCEVYREVVQR